MILKNKYSLIHRPEPPAHPFTSEALFQKISRLIPTQAQINNLYRNRIISTFWLRNLKSWRGNCMRLFRCCTRWGTLHPIRAGASSLMGCTARSATSSDAGARHRQRKHHNWAQHDAPFHFPEATHHEAAHREAVDIRPQSRLLLSGIALLSAALH